MNPATREPFSAARAILRKRGGHEHPPGEIEELIGGFLDGAVADYQMTAWLMAIFFRGMSREETSRLTRAMRDLGNRLGAWKSGPPVVDKHSTGGIGDKVSLIVAPLAAACGLRIPMISGRALGHTGGTLDKLESIPGYRVDLDCEEFQRIVDRVGCSIAGASSALVPADRRMYALRDVSGIVESPPLIVSSIISKKSAARLEGLVLDVKVGAGGFIPELAEARELARLLVGAATDLGMRTEALLTRMDDPVGRAVGNAVEVEEAIRALRGEPIPPDLEDVCLHVAAAMLRVGGAKEGEDALHARLIAALRSGEALERFAAMIDAHGGDPRVTRDPTLLPQPESRHVVRAEHSGWIGGIAAREIGEIVIDLGGGRRRAGDSIDPRAGILLLAKRGDRIAAGDPLCEIRVGATDLSPGVTEKRLREAFLVRSDPPPAETAILGRLSGPDV